MLLLIQRPLPVAAAAAAAPAHEPIPHHPPHHHHDRHGWLIALVLSTAGVLVVAKDQIFPGAAVAQASALGVALAVYAGAVLHSAAFAEEAPLRLPSILAVLFSVIASLVTTRAGSGRRKSHEAVTGWIFLLCASLSVLLLSHSPHGLKEIHRLAAASIIGATDADVWLFTGLAAITDRSHHGRRGRTPYRLVDADHRRA